MFFWRFIVQYIEKHLIIQTALKYSDIKIDYLNGVLLCG